MPLIAIAVLIIVLLPLLFVGAMLLAVVSTLMLLAHERLRPWA